MSQENDVESAIQSAIALNDDSILSIVRDAKEFSGSDEERNYAIAASGFALGYKYAINDPLKSGTSITSLHGGQSVSESMLLQATVRAFNDRLTVENEPETQAWIVQTREPIAKFLSVRSQAQLALITKAFKDLYGLDPEITLGQKEATEDQIVGLAVRSLAMNASHYGGFVVYEGEEDEKGCKCPACRALGFSLSGKTQEQVTILADKKFGSQMKAIEAFGAYFLKGLRSLIESAKQGGDGTGHIDISHVATSGQKLYGRLQGKTD